MRRHLRDLDMQELRIEFRWVKVELIVALAALVAFVIGDMALGYTGLGIVGVLMLRPNRPTS